MNNSIFNYSTLQGKHFSNEEETKKTRRKYEEEVKKIFIIPSEWWVIQCVSTDKRRPNNHPREDFVPLDAAKQKSLNLAVIVNGFLSIEWTNTRLDDSDLQLNRSPLKCTLLHEGNKKVILIFRALSGTTLITKDFFSASSLEIEVLLVHCMRLFEYYILLHCCCHHALIPWLFLDCAMNIFV